MVLVCHNHQFIFIKTRKTAGTSIEMLLEPFCAPPGHKIVERRTALVTEYGIVGHRLYGPLPEGEPFWREHIPAWQARRELGRELWKSYFRFSAVRNPFDRAVSFFHWERAYRGLPDFSNFDQIRQSFRDFLLEGHLRDDKSVVHRRGNYMLHDAIRYESLQDDLRRICDRVGVRPDFDALPRTKSDTGRDRRRPVAEYFDSDTTASVLATQAWVFERFGYSKSPSDCGVSA